MSDNIIFLLIGFIAGAIVGGYVGAKRATNELEGAIERLQNGDEECIEEGEKTAQRGVQRRTEASERVDITTAEKKQEKEPRKEEKIDFVEMSKAYRSDSFDAHFADRAHPEDDEDEDCEDDDLDDPDDIYLINEGEYYHDITIRKNERLHYYQEDGVLTDHGGEPIRNQVDIIGVEAMEEICDTTDDFMYVSNDILDTIYEIVVEHDQSYYRDVMGV